MNSPAADMRVRRMSAADLERVIGIAASLKEAPRWPRTAYLAALDPEAAPRRIALVAEKAGSGLVEGFAIVSLLPPQGELELIAVDGEKQRRGTGRLLLAALAEELWAAGVREALLEVRASNQGARAFYRALGWGETGRRPRYYADPEEDAVLMSLQLG